MADLPWDLRRRALQDSMRHDKRVKEAIRQHLKELIAEETLITADGKRLVKIPLRYLEQYRFRFGQWGGGAGPPAAAPPPGALEHRRLSFLRWRSLGRR